MVELAPFLARLGLSQYVETFAESDIDGLATPDMRAAKALLDDLG
jgi:hypothetical protein